MISLRRVHNQVMYPRYHSNCTPAGRPFRLQQVLCSHAAVTGGVYWPYGVRTSSSEGMGPWSILLPGLPPPPGSLGTDRSVRLRHRFSIHLLGSLHHAPSFVKRKNFPTGHKSARKNLYYIKISISCISIHFLLYYPRNRLTIANISPTAGIFLRSYRRMAGRGLLLDSLTIFK